jgi:hypothetical protein
MQGLEPFMPQYHGSAEVYDLFALQLLELTWKSWIQVYDQDPSPDRFQQQVIR